MPFKSSTKVVAKSSAFSRPILLAALGMNPDDPEAEKVLSDLSRRINQDLTCIGSGACIFELNTAPNEGWLAVTAIEESCYDHYQEKLPEILPKEKVEEIVSKAVQAVRDA